MTKILPKDIRVNDHWFNTFGKYETETSARLLVKFCQKLSKNKWPKFISKSELDKEYKENFWFNGLDRDNWIKIIDDKIYLTDAFIAHCYAKQGIFS